MDEDDDFKRSPLDRIKDAFARFENGQAAIIHFSTGKIGHDDPGATPLNHAVAYWRTKSGTIEQHIFDAHPDNDKTNSTYEAHAIELLAEWYRSSPGVLWIVWRHELGYGFSHLARRLERLTKKSPTLPTAAEIFDLNENLQQCYDNKDYAPHKRDGYSTKGRINNCFGMNDITPANLMTAEECEAAWRDGKLELLRLNTVAHLKGFYDVLKLAAQGKLIVSTKPAPTEITRVFKRRGRPLADESKKDSQIAEMRKGGQTRNDIAQALGLTSEQVKKALDRSRKKSTRRNGVNSK